MRVFRLFMFVLCVIQAFFAIAYIVQLPFALDLWPLRYTNDMSFLLVGSIFAAAATSTFWCLRAREEGALAGIALDYMAIFAPVTVLAIQLHQRSGGLLPFILASAISVLFGVGLFLWSVRIPIRDPRPLPRPVRWSFMLFIAALIVVGGLLIFKTRNILPWSVTPAGGIIYGWMFLGAATYFAYSLLRPKWHNAVGQLIGFLAYDVVLIVPFLRRLPTVPDHWRLGLIIYTLVVVYSGGLAIYYLFINRKTRLPLPFRRSDSAESVTMVSPQS